MFVSVNLSTPRVRSKSVPLIRIPKVREVVRSVLTNGLVTSIVQSEKYDSDCDEHQDFRDYSLRTLIAVEAIDLLKPVGSIPMSDLFAAEKVGTVSVQMSDFRDNLENLKQQLSDQQKAANVTPSNVEK